jgi:hypothetical protein
MSGFLHLFILKKAQHNLVSANKFQRYSSVAQAAASA